MRPPRRAFRTIDDLELATLCWVHWFNTNRLHTALGYQTPVELEHAYYRRSPPRGSRCRENPPCTEPGRFRTRTDRRPRHGPGRATRSVNCSTSCSCLRSPSGPASSKPSARPCSTGSRDPRPSWSMARTGSRSLPRTGPSLPGVPPAAGRPARRSCGQGLGAGPSRCRGRRPDQKEFKGDEPMSFDAARRVGVGRGARLRP